MSARRLSSLLAGIREVPANLDRDVAGLCLDSRHAVKGGVFMACAGISSHGLDYVDQAIRLGAEVILWEPDEGVRLPVFPESIVVLAVPGLSEVAGNIAARFHGDPSAAMSVIGVTGTNGKTSVTHLIAQALNARDEACAVLGTLGYGFPGALTEASHTTPDAVRLQELMASLRDQSANAVAMEVSSHALHQHRVDGLHFHTAAFTNLTHDHLDYHGDLGQYAQAKRRLFTWKQLKHAVINADDPVGRQWLEELAGELPLMAYATRAESLQGLRECRKLLADDVRCDDRGIGMALDIDGNRLVLQAALFGHFNVSNLLAVCGVLLGLGVAPAELAGIARKLRGVRGRMERQGGGDLPLVIVDYAHTPDALTQVLTAAREHAVGKLFCVFGCGGDRDRAKRPAMGRIAEAMADVVWVTDDNPRTEDADVIVKEILGGMREPESAKVERDRAKAIRAAVGAARSGDVVVIAGKGHEDYQIVGSQRMNFSDAECVKSALQGMAGGRP